MQLTLGLNIRDDATFTNFFKGSNSHLIESLQDCVLGHGEQFIYFWGNSGVGRSHLLQACCHVASQRRQSVAYLPLSEHQTLSPEIFENLEKLNLVCIDDIDAVLTKKTWEETLFHFYNRFRETNNRLIVVASQAPSQLPFLMPDLQSRLASGLIFQVRALTDEQMIMALQMRAYHRGLHVSREVGQYLLRHYARNMGILFDALTKLDHASMIAKRRLTIPFIKQVLNEELVNV